MFEQKGNKCTIYNPGTVGLLQDRINLPCFSNFYMVLKTQVETLFRNPQNYFEEENCCCKPTTSFIVQPSSIYVYNSSCQRAFYRISVCGSRCEGLNDGIHGLQGCNPPWPEKGATKTFNS
jgi:hypothetical protein